MSKRVLLITAVFLLAAGCGNKPPKLADDSAPPQKENLPAPSGGFVLVVSGETITCEEVIAPIMEQSRPVAQSSDFEQFANQARPVLEQILATKVANILLFQEAKKKAGDNVDQALEKAVEAEVRKFIDQFRGDTAKAENALKEMGMDWVKFKDYQKRMIMIQSYVYSQMPKDTLVTYSELLDRYNATKDEFFVAPSSIQFRLIDIDVAKLEAAKPNENQLEKARSLANELVGQIQKGKDFGELAKKYSTGYKRQAGGLWQPVQPQSLAEPYDILAAHARFMKPGEVAGPIEKSGHIFIMKLEAKSDEVIEPFEKVQSQLEAQILFERRKNAVDNLSEKLMQEATIAKKDDFLDFCLRKLYSSASEKKK